MINYLANPNRFLNIIKPVEFSIGALSFLFIFIGLYLSLFYSPEDYQQGDTVRIMYIHVPFAWFASFLYLSISIASIFFLIWRHPFADIIARSVAPLGLIFSILTILTGSLWGKPMWGTWWVWDARLTSMFILLFIYLGFIIVSKSFNDPLKGDKISSIFAIIGFINIPIIKFSVDIWTTLHQPATISKLDTPSIHIDMLIPLLVMFASFIFLFLYIFSIRFFSELNLRRYVAYTLSSK